MIHRRSENKNLSPGIRLLKEPYLFVNLSFAIIILLVLVYSFIFSPYNNNYPVACMHEKITGVPCASCGLSHSFSLIIRGEINESSLWNPYGLRIFIFFAGQLLLRAGFSFHYLLYPSKSKEFIIIDSIGSVMMFLIAFWPFLSWLVKMILAEN